MKVGLIQLSVTDDPVTNLSVTRDLLRKAAGDGAGFVLTPECTNCLSSDRAHQLRVLQTETEDLTLAGLRAEATQLGIWLLIGSLGLLTEDADGRFANRSLLIAPDGRIAARYDKIHMFDADVSATEQYRESARYRPGSSAVLAQTPFGCVGLSVCYDLRFPTLFRTLAKAGAEILTVPAVFNDTTGAAHWEVLLRARAIENGAYVLAPAQTGTHGMHNGHPRRTYGHSLAVAPWGEILADGGTQVGITYATIDRSAVAQARARVPSLHHDRDFGRPQP